MEILFWILTALGALLGISYFLMIAAYCYGWSNLPEVKDSTLPSVSLSVVIAIRDEEANIVRCLDSLVAQDYPQALKEIIIVDDHSDDRSAELIAGFTAKHEWIRYFRLPEKNAGKKDAVLFGIQRSKGELIVCTDGDCVMGAQWLNSFATFYESNKSAMIVGPVAFQEENSFFKKMQSLEFMALIACGAGSLYFKQAILCNGANLAFTKDAFNSVGGYENINEKASGDDVLLMYKMSEKRPGEVRFLKDERAIVRTNARETLSSFVSQRKRWASKGFGALNAETKRVSLLVWLFSAWLVFAPVIGCLCFTNTAFHPIFLEICLILFGIKCFIDFLLLFLSASFFRKKVLLLLFIPEQVIYLIYVVVFGLIGPIGDYEWKGRKTK